MELVELSNRRIVEWWNGGVCGVVESSNSEMVELWELSDRRIVEDGDGGVVE